MTMTTTIPMPTARMVSPTSDLTTTTTHHPTPTVPLLRRHIPHPRGAALMGDHWVALDPSAAKEVDKWLREAKTLVFVAVDEELGQASVEGCPPQS